MNGDSGWEDTGSDDPRRTALVYQDSPRRHRIE
jgi:hypothetical protein